MRKYTCLRLNCEEEKISSIELMSINLNIMMMIAKIISYKINVKGKGCNKNEYGEKD